MEAPTRATSRQAVKNRSVDPTVWSLGRCGSASAAARSSACCCQSAPRVRSYLTANGSEVTHASSMPLWPLCLCGVTITLLWNTITLF